MLSPKEFVEPSLRISSKSIYLNPQSLRDSPLSRGVMSRGVTLLCCSLSNVHRTFS